MPLMYCTNCGEALFPALRHHRCEPAWYVRLDWHEKGDEKKTHAASAQEAAEKFCERHDTNGDYHIARQGEANVIVYDAKMELAGVFDVGAETRPHYYATGVYLSDEERKALAHDDEEVQDPDAEGEAAA